MNNDAIAIWTLTVAELCEILRRSECPGLIGYGAFGRELRTIAESCGVRVMLCDPPLSRDNADDQFGAICEQWGNGMGGCNPDMPDDDTFLPKETLARCCDLIAVQVPLTENGPDATNGLLDSAFLAICKHGMRILCFSDPHVVTADVSSRIEFCQLENQANGVK